MQVPVFSISTQRRWMQRCFLTPGPPYLTISKQFAHTLQSGARQPAQRPHPLCLPTSPRGSILECY